MSLCLAKVTRPQFSLASQSVLRGTVWGEAGRPCGLTWPHLAREAPGRQALGFLGSFPATVSSLQEGRTCRLPCGAFEDWLLVPGPVCAGQASGPPGSLPGALQPLTVAPAPELRACLIPASQFTPELQQRIWGDPADHLCRCHFYSRGNG